MNINFNIIFLNDTGQLKKPEKIANSILLIKDLNIASYVKSEMIEWLNLQGYKTSFLPEIATIYDLARDISGMGVGKEIREEDFIVLMERCNIEGLLLKFKLKKYRNYKKNLFRLLDHISLYTKNNIPNDVQNDLDKNGLTKNVISNIIEYINGKEFYFKGQIFDKAIDIVKSDPNQQDIFTLRFSENEISFKEKAFIDFLNAQSITIDLQGEYSALTDILQDKDAKFSPEKLEFYRSNSALDQAIRIKHLVLSNIAEKQFDLKDINIVCSDTSSFMIMNDLFDSSGILVNSSHKYLKNDISIDVLKLIQAGMNNDAQTVLNFFNLYIAEEPVKADNMLGTDIETLSAKLLRRDSDIQLKFKSNRSKETVFKEFLRSIKVKDTEYETEKGLTRLYGLIKNIKDILSLKIDYDVFQFKPALLKIFGEKLLLSEMIEYLYLISSKTKKVRPYRENSGINISMMNEPLPDGKFIIFTDLIEGTFLKSSSTINILNKDSYKMFYQELYGVDQDTALLENFRTFISGKTEKIAFVLPLWGDDIIVSTHLNKILAQFPKKKMDIKIAGDIHDLNSDPRLKDIPFSLTVNDLKDDENILKNIPVMIEKDNLVNNEFAIDLKEGEIEKYLSSASKIESFMSCPAKFVHDLNNGYDAIESQRPFIYGNLLHSVTEELINFYKGKDLLTELEFNALSENFMNKSKGSIVDSKLNLFTEYYFTGAIGDFDLKLSFDLLRSKLDDAGIDKKIADYKTEQLKNDPYSDHSIEQKLYEAVGFLIRFILELGPTPADVTRTFVTEVKFDDMVISEDPKIVIKQGYIDFLYVDYENETRLYDIKSTKKFQDYEDELSSYQKVQVLIYKEAMERWIREHGLVNFDVKNDGYNKDCTILNDEHKSYMISLRIDPYYISPKRPYVLSCGEQSWDEFLKQFTGRLNDKKKFYPISNSNCQYCELGSSCPKNEQSKFVLPPDMNEKTNFINTAEIFKFKKKEVKEKANTKNFILFDGDKDKAVRSNNDVIISAGAGAGKTEVLSSKYVRLLIDEYGTDIENIVCITFTNKAAGEMQNRIYSKLNDVIESKIFVSIDQGKDLSNYIVEEKIISKLIKSREKFFEKNLISTFHSFCNLFITKYGSFSSNLTDYDINQSISEDFKIDSEITKFLKKEYETGFKDVFTSKLTDEEIEIFEKWLLKKHLIYSGDNQGGFIPDLKNLMSEMRLSGKELSSEKWIKPLDDYLQQEKDLFEEWGEEYSEHKKRVLLLLEQHINSIEDETKISKLKIAYSKVMNGEKFNFIRDISGKLFSELKEVVNQMKKLSLYKLINEGSINFDMSKYEWTIKKAIVNIIFALTEHIAEYKKLNGLIEQNDLHLIFLELLKDNVVLKELKDQFKHILVDEFQDTNWLQDKIIESLKTDNNRLFIVGDKKQSIYRFQQCDVQIYEKYLQKYKAGKLSFNDNFRSAEDIVNFNNKIFSNPGKEEYEIIEAGEQSQFQKSNLNDTSINFVNIHCPDQFVSGDNKLKASSNNRLLKMAEAKYIADTIKSNCTEAKDHDDWTILIRKYTHVNYLTEAFRKMNIPYVLILKRDLFKLNEIAEFITIIKIALKIFKVSEIEYIENSAEIFENIDIKDDISSIIFKVYNNKIYRDYLNSFKDVNSKLMNIQIAVEKLIEIAINSENDKERFLTELEQNIISNSSGVVVSSDNAVTIMTVHSAKGLEFENVILANIDENDRDKYQTMNFLNYYDKSRLKNHIDISMTGYKNITNSKKESFFKYEYIKFMNKKFSIRENSNLLYVAMTRAKNNLMVVFSTIKKDLGTKLDHKWVNYLKEYAIECNDPGFKYSQVGVDELDITKFMAETEKSEMCTIKVEKEYDLPEFVKSKDLHSATEMSKEDKEETHEADNSIAIETGNFVHLFLSKKINSIFDTEFDLTSEINKFKEIHTSGSSVNMKTVEKMLQNVINDSLFKDLILNSSDILCEKNIIDTTDDRIQGYVDLLVLKDNEVFVLDYKTYLKNFPNDEVLKKNQNQVNIYSDAMKKIYPSKQVKKYLYYIGKNKADLREIGV